MRDDILDDGTYLPKANTAENAREILRLKGDYSELHKKVKHGRNSIYWLIGLTVLGFIIEGAQLGFDPIVVGIYVGVLVIYIASAVLANKKPFLGFTIALVLLILMQILMFIGDPLASIKGVLVRGIIAYFLIVGIGAANKYLNTLQGLMAHGITVEGSEIVSKSMI